MNLGQLLQIDRPLVVLDLETTSENPDQARIVEIGLEIFKPGEESSRLWSHLVHPGIPIPPGATAIHRITDEAVQHEPRFEVFADNLRGGFIGVDFAGTNVRYDLRVLQQEFKRCGRTWDYEGARLIDSYRIWQVGEPRSLEDACERWPNAADGANRFHRAGDDAVVSARVICEQLAEWTQLPRTVAELDALLAPDRFDADGKLRWRDDRLIFNFGQHRGRDLADVDDGYLRYIIRKDFSAKVKTAASDVLEGRYPVRPNMEEGLDAPTDEPSARSAG